MSDESRLEQAAIAALRGSGRVEFDWDSIGPVNKERWRSVARAVQGVLERDEVTPELEIWGLTGREAAYQMLTEIRDGLNPWVAMTFPEETGRAVAVDRTSRLIAALAAAREGEQDR